MDLLREKRTKVFVATGYQQRSDGAELMRALEARGLTITCDWTLDSDLNKEDKADRDIAAVKAAQVLVVLMTLPAYAYQGTWTELGIAIGANIPIVLVSPFGPADETTCARNIYFHLRQAQRFNSVRALLEAIDAKTA